MKKEIYEKLQQKHNLPHYNELNLEFDIEEISDETELILQKIRLKIHERIDFYTELIESIVQPETNLKNMYESKHVNERTRENAYLLFKKLMQLIRYSNLVSVNNTNEDNAKFIKESYQKWNNLKEDIQSQIKILHDVWKKDTDIKQDFSYFG